MFAVIAAILFGLAVLLDLTKASLGTTLTSPVLVNLGLLCVALHLAGVLAGWRVPRRRR